MHLNNLTSETVLLAVIGLEIFPNAYALALTNQLRLLKFCIVLGVKVHIFGRA